MKLRAIILVVFLLLAAGVAVTAARSDGSDTDMGDQEQNQEQIRDPLQDPIQNQTREQSENRTQNRTQEQLEEQDRIQEQERLRIQNVTELQEQIQERKQEQEQIQAQLPADQQRVLARYSNVSAFVHILQNESRTRALLGEGPNGIGPQVSEYAREFNNSLQAQIQAEERIANRNAVIRLFAGGDKEAAGILKQETIQNQERIQQMQQLITQCQECDPQLRALLQTELQQMELQQTRLQQLAQTERQDRGLFGWLWK